jgi:hypothetical protein
MRQRAYARGWTRPRDSFPRDASVVPNSGARRTVHTLDPAADGIWSFDVTPDGRWLAMVVSYTDRSTPSPTVTMRLEVVAIDGSQPPRVLHEWGPGGRIPTVVRWTTGSNVVGPPLDVALGDPSGPGYWMLDAVGNVWPFGAPSSTAPGFVRRPSVSPAAERAVDQTGALRNESAPTSGTP